MRSFTNLVKTYTPKSLPSWRSGTGNTQGTEQASETTGFSANRLSPRSVSLSDLPTRPSSPLKTDEDADLEDFVLVGEAPEKEGGADATRANADGDGIAPDKLDDKGKEPEGKLPAKRDAASATDPDGVAPDVELNDDIESSSSDESTDGTHAHPGGDSIAPLKVDDKGKEPERKPRAKRDIASPTDLDGAEPDVDLNDDFESSSSDESASGRSTTGKGPPPPDWKPVVPFNTPNEVLQSIPSGEVVAGHLSQAMVNYIAGVGAFSGSFAIGGLLAAVFGLAHPGAAGVMYPLVAGPLHASVGESLAMMVRANWGSAYASPCGVAWNAYSDALADLIAASIAGDPGAAEDAREKMNTQILKVWSIVHPDQPAPKPTPEEKRREIISHATMARAMGIAFATDELPFFWFALSYAAAGTAGLEILRSIARGATDWQLRESAIFAMSNCANFLGFGALLGGAMTTVTQNVLRSLLPGAPPPTRGINRGKVLDRKIAATREKIAELQRIRDEDLDPLIQNFSTVDLPSDEQVADLERAKVYLGKLEDAMKGLEKELGNLTKQRQLSRRERDQATFSGTITSLFTDPAKRFNQITKLIGNVMCLTPYARQVVELNTANAQLAQDLVAQTATSAQLSQVTTLNRVIGPTLIGMWYTRMPLQLVAKVAYGVGSGLVQSFNKPAAQGATAAQTTTVDDPHRTQDDADNALENVDGMDNRSAHESTSSSSSSASEDLGRSERVLIEPDNEGGVDDRFVEERFDDDMGDFVVVPPEDTGDDDMDQLVNQVRDLIGSHKSGQLSEIGRSILNALTREADADNPSRDGGSSDDPDNPD